MVFFVPPQAGSVGPAGPTGPPGSGGDRFYLRFTHSGGVPAGGTQYLRLGVGVFSSEDGDMPTANFTIRGISVTLDVVDAAHTYDVEILSDPSGSGGTGPTLEAVLAIALSTLRVRDRTYAVAIAGLLDLGVRLVRTGGPPTASSFGEIVVTVEVSIP